MARSNRPRGTRCPQRRVRFSRVPADRNLVYLENLQAIFDAMTARQQVVAMLRLEGLYPEQIAELLDVTPQAISSRLNIAAERVAQALPEFALFLEGRNRLQGKVIPSRRKPEPEP
jgi:hypothetical protein